jgi:hypothetical protein
MKRCAFITLGDDVPPAARVQQPAAELRRLRQAWADIRAWLQLEQKASGRRGLTA